MDEKLLLAREITSCLCGMEVWMVSEEDLSLHHFLSQSIYGDLRPLISTGVVRNILEDMQPECLYILSGILDLCYVVIRLRDHRVLCAGPCMTAAFSESSVRGMLRSFRLNNQATERVLEYCRWQPVLSQATLHRFGVLLCCHVLDMAEPVPYRTVDYRWYQSAQPPIPELEPEASNIHRIEQRYEASAALTEAVKQGNLSLAYSFVQGFQPGRSEIVRNTDPVRNAQNICIILNTQLRHALEECHVHPYLLDKVSEDIALHIETLKSPQQATKFCAEIIRRYCELSVEGKYQNLSRLTRQAVVYIKTRLSDNLTVKDAAKALLVNANYLSGIFRREMGISFIEFVNRERVEQAAALLRHTNMQIQRIAASVGYNNTSYFTRRFVRTWGCTPKDYRTKGAKQKQK